MGVGLATIPIKTELDYIFTGPMKVWVGSTQPKDINWPKTINYVQLIIRMVLLTLFFFFFFLLLYSIIIIIVIYIGRNFKNRVKSDYVINQTKPTSPRTTNLTEY